ncbi:MAG TPA: S8 family serine peptidase [Candidatus Thermoplasmatota archaeon]|nr:S8 family serine peptidase [Candidatus Thermoplasmatota archaeon]
MKSTLSAIAVALLMVVPTLVTSDMVAGQTTTPPSALGQTPPLGLSDADLVAWTFPADGRKDTSTDPNPLERLTGYSYVFPGTTPGSTIHILAAGIQRGGSKPLDPAHDAFRFHTMDTDRASFNGYLGHVTGDTTAHAIIVCRVKTATADMPCADLTMSVGVQGAPLSTRTGLTPDRLVASGTQTPAFSPSSDHSAFAHPLTWANMRTETTVADPVTATRTDFTDGSIFTVRLAPLSGTSAGSLTSSFVLLAPHLYGLTDGAVLQSFGQYGVNQVVYLDARLLKGTAAVGAFREPVWRTMHGETANDDWGLRFCTIAYPGPEAIQQWMSGRGGDAPTWMNSCRREASNTLRLTWSEFLASPSVAQVREAASANNDLTKLGALAEAFVKSHLGLGTEKGRRGPTHCNQYNPCLWVLPPATGHGVKVLDVRVKAGDQWVEPLNDARVFGGPTRIMLSIQDMFLNTGGTPVDFAHTGSEQPLLTLEIVPSPVAKPTATGFIVDRPGEDIAGGFLTLGMKENTLGLGVGGKPRAAAIPLLASPVGGSVSPYIVDWATEGPVATVEALRSCVNVAYSHNDVGLPPNWGSATEPRLALDNAVGATCYDLKDLIENLTRVRLPNVQLGLLLEIREGDGFGVEVELPYLPAVKAHAAWQRGEDTRNGWRFPLHALAQGSPAPWMDGSPLSIDLEDRTHAKMARLVITLPDYLPKDVLADVSLLLSYVLQGLAVAVHIEIDDLPSTPFTEMILPEIDKIADKLNLPHLPLVISAGTLPTRLVGGLAPEERLFTITGLAADPRFITIGAGNLTHGVAPWSRLGPGPALTPKPDFLAPSPVDATLISVANVVPLVEMFMLAGIRESEAVRGALASIAIPVGELKPTVAGTPYHTFYMQGYGVLDIETLLGDLTPDDSIPALNLLVGLARTAFKTVPIEGVPGIAPLEQPRPMAAPLYGSAVVFDNVTRKFLVFGGRTEWQQGCPDFSAYACRTVWEYDPKANGSMRKVATLPFNLIVGDAALVGREVFLVQEGNPGWIWKYNLTTQVFTRTATNLSAHTYMPKLAWTGKDLVILNDRTVIHYDPVSDRRTALRANHLPFTAKGSAVFTNGTHLFIAGGGVCQTPPEKPCAHLLRLNTATDAVATFGTGFPAAFKAAAAVYDGRYGFVFGGDTGSSSTSTPTALAYRVDPTNGEVKALTTLLPSLQTNYMGAAFDGEEAWLFGGGGPTGISRTVLRTPTSIPRAVGPAMVPPHFSGIVDDVEDPREILGLTLPPGLLDILQWDGRVRVHIDAPLIPGALFTDWGTVDHARASPMGLKLIDIEPGIGASAALLRNLVTNATGIAGPARDILRDALGLLDLSVAGPDRVTVESEHYYLFDLLKTDYLFAAQRALLVKARETANDPSRVPADPTGYLVDTVKALLPKPYHLTETLHGLAEGDVSYRPRGCLRLDDFLAFLRDTAMAIDSAKGGLVQANAAAPLLHPLSDAKAAWLAKKATSSTGVFLLNSALCDVQNLPDYVLSARLLRTELQQLQEVRHSLNLTAGLAVKYLDPPSSAYTYDVLNRTARMTGAPGLVMNTSGELAVATGALIEELDLMVNHLLDLIARLKSLPIVDTHHPGVTSRTIPAATTQAPLGPYVGVTLVTTHDVTLRNPLTGKVLLTRDVTVPLPSLLWNNPGLEVTVSHRDGTPSVDQALTLFDPGFGVFNDFTLEPNLVVDGLKIPLLKRLPQALADLAAGQTGALPPGVPREDPANVTGLIEARLQALDPNPANESAAIERAALKLVLSALKNLLDDLTNTVNPAGSFDGFLTGLYSKPRTLGEHTNGVGKVRFGQLFPNRGVSAYYPYAYGATRLLDRDYPAWLPPGADRANLKDTDLDVHTALRRLIADEDGSPSPGSRPYWAHSPGTLPEAITRKDATSYAYRLYEVHGSSKGPYHQFGLKVEAGLDPVGLACALLGSRNLALGTLHLPPFDCGLSSLNGLPDLLVRKIGALCSATTREEDCARGLLAAVNATGNATTKVAACMEEIEDPYGCEALVQAGDILETLLGLLGGPILPDTAPMPYVESFPRILARNGLRLGLNPDTLGGWIMEENGLVNTTAQWAAVKSLASTILEDLPSYVNASIKVKEPKREITDRYLIAQGLQGHGGDNVTGFDWAASRFPPALNGTEMVNATRTLLAQAKGLLQDPAARAWADGAVAALQSAPAVTLVDDLKPPTSVEVLSLVDRFRPQGGVPAQDGSEGGMSDRSRAWLPKDGLRGVRIENAPRPQTRSLDLASLEAELRKSLGVSIGGVDPGVTLGVSETPPYENGCWSSKIWGANLLRHGHEMGVDEEELMSMAAPAVECVNSVVTWRFDRTADAIRARSLSMTPKVGVFTYSVPLAPQEHILLRLDGEYYFQNTDALLIVTPHDEVRDLVLTLTEGLQEVVAGNPNPAFRALSALRFLDSSVAAALGEEGDPLFRARHLNAAVQVEYEDRTMEGDTLHSSSLLTRFGGLRVRGAGDSFEFLTRGSGDGRQIGYDEMHAIYVFFPLVDEESLTTVAAWATAVDPHRPTDELQDFQAFLESMGSEFIIRNFTLSWDTYIGVTSQEGGKSLPLVNPHRENVEDVKLAWAVPANRYGDDLTVSLTGPGGALALADADLLQNTPASRRGANSWNTLCGDTFTPGAWYTPSLHEPRGIASLRKDGHLYSEVLHCVETDIANLMPVKEYEIPVRMPTIYRQPGRSLLAALQYDVNTRFTNYEVAVKPGTPFHADEDRSSLYNVPTAIALPNLGLEGLPELPVLPKTTRTLSQVPLQVLRGGAGGILGGLSQLQGAAYRLTEALGEQLPAFGVIRGYLPSPTYVGSSDFALGAGPTLTHWVVFDEQDLARFPANTPGKRPLLTLSDGFAFDPNRPFEQPDFLPARALGPGPGRSTMTLLPPFLGELLQNATQIAVIERAFETLEDADGDGLGDPLERLLRDLSPGAPVQVLVTFGSLQEAAEGAARLEELGALVTGEGKHIPVVSALVTASLVHLLPTVPGVQLVEHNGVLDAHLSSSTVAMRAPEARAATGATGRGVGIAILDTGIDAAHAMLDDQDDDPATTDPKVVAWKDFVSGLAAPYDDNRVGHGTHVASTAAGTAGVSGGTPGVAPGASLIVGKVLSGQGSGRWEHLVAAVDWVLDQRDAHNIRVLSMSLGGQPGSAHGALAAAMRAAREAGLVVIASAGNGGDHPEGTIGYPAALPDVVAVGAVTDWGAVAPYSSRGPGPDGAQKPDVTAPGHEVSAAAAGTASGRRILSGTSMAAPHVAGLAALMIERSGTTLTAETVVSLLKDTAVEAGPAGWDRDFGHGRVDAVRALNAVVPHPVNLFVRALEGPELLAPGATTTIRALVANGGTETVAGVAVTLHVDGALVGTLSVGSLAAGERREVSFPWQAPATEGKASFVIAATIPPGEATPEDNQVAFSALVSRLTRTMHNHWVSFTQAFDPGRIVLAHTTSIMMRTQSSEVSARDQYLVYTGSAVLDGFTGEILGVDTLMEAEVLAHNGPDPFADTKVTGTLSLSAVRLATSVGGTAEHQRPGDGTRARFTPPMACWNAPESRALLHGMCWQGAVVGAVGGRLTASVSTHCLAPLTNYVRSLTGPSDAFLRTYNYAALYGDSLVWPVYSGGAPQVTEPGVPPLAGYVAGTGAAAAATAATFAVCVAQQAVATGANLLAPPVPFVVAGSPEVRCVPSGGVFTGPCAMPVVPDLVSTLPVRGEEAYVPLDLPISPSPPRSVATKSGPAKGEIQVTWRPPIGPVKGYRVWGGNSPTNLTLLAEVGRVSYYVDGIFADYTERYYALESVWTNGAISTRTAAVKGMAASPPQAPTDVLAVVSTSNSNEAEITWRLPANTGGAPVTGYDIEHCYARALSPTVIVACPSQNTWAKDKPPYHVEDPNHATKARVSLLVGNGPNVHYFRVRELNPWGAGVWSEKAVVTR